MTAPAPAPARLVWDNVGERFYETGVDRGVLYVRDNTGAYVGGVAWNGLTTVTESPGGADANPLYADNIKYLNLVAVETLDGTIEAYTYPEEFGQCDGTASPEVGVNIGQQGRKTFGLCYRTRRGNDQDGVDHGYKLHLLYGALAQPSERAYASINDSPDAITFSWGFSTTAVDVGTIGGVAYKPTSLITVDSTKVEAADLAALEDVLYGHAAGDGGNPAGAAARLPLPADVIAMFSATP
jgi:hypothetical protein